MSKRHTETLWFAFLFTFIISVMLSGSAQAQAGLDDQGPPEPPVVVSHDETGYASFISAGELGEMELPEVMGRSVRPGQLAFAYLEAYGSYFGLRDARTELELLSQDLTPQNNNFRYQQVFRGVPVMAGELIVNTSADGGLRSMSGELSPELGLDVKPAILPEAAAQTALGVIAKDHNVPLESLEAAEPELWIYDEQLLRPSERPVELVWRMDVASTTGAPIRELVLINARTGGVSLHFNQIDTLWHDLAAQQEDVPEPTSTPEPTVEPTEEPAAEPTVQPTVEPAAEPTPEPALDSVPQADGLTWYVSTTGDDLNDCATPTTPCATIQAAVDKAGSGDTVLIAGGTYTGTGDAVVSITTSISVIGGWDATFTSQSEVTVIDGENSRRGINSIGEQIIISDVWVLRGETLNMGGGIYITDSTTIRNSTISESHASGYGGGVAILGDHYATVNLENTTLYENSSDTSGGGVYIKTSGTVNVLNSVIYGNRAVNSGGGFNINGDVWEARFNLYNSILYGNEGSSYAHNNCHDWYSLVLSSMNIIENDDYCFDTYTSENNIFGVNPILSELDSTLGTMVPFEGSPAIDAGSTLLPGTDLSACLPYDKTGSIRPKDGDNDGEAVCDIGTIEVIDPQPPVYKASEAQIIAGNYQIAYLNSTFKTRFEIRIWDRFENPLENAEITFTAPSFGPSGNFVSDNSNSIVVYSDSQGYAVAPEFLANDIEGAFQISIQVADFAEPIYLSLQNFDPVYFYVTETGDDSQECLSATDACKTLAAAVTKAADGDIILLQVGTYTSTDTSVATINKKLTISGGWNSDFSSQEGYSVLDGESVRRVLIIESEFARLEKIWIRNGNVGTSQSGAGLFIRYSKRVEISQNIFTDNKARSGSGIFATSVDPNGTDQLIITNSSFANNEATGSGGVISSTKYNTTINNSTIVGNITQGGYGISISGYGTQIFIFNSFIANNLDSSSENPESNCHLRPDRESVLLLSHNVLGDDCSGFASGDTNQINVSAELIDAVSVSGFYIIREVSEPLDAGSPLEPGTSVRACDPHDIRGAQRPFDGDNDSIAVCDAGAFEYTGSESTPMHVVPYGAKDFFVESETVVPLPFRAVVIGENYGVVSGVEVTFTSPASGPSGVFVSTGTNIASVISDENGLVISPDFIPNTTEGTYLVTASIPGGETEAVFSLKNWKNHIWYVSPGGDNSNDCLSPLSPCLDIDEPLQKLLFYPHDKIYLAEGEYGLGLFDRSAVISGGWNSDFTSQTGYSTIDGLSSYKRLTLNNYSQLEDLASYTLDHLKIQNTILDVKDAELILSDAIIIGKGVELGNAGTALFERVLIQETDGYGILVSDNVSVILRDSAIVDGKSSGFFASRYATGSDVLIENTTISGNKLGGILLDDSEISLTLSNVTITNNIGSAGIKKTGGGSSVSFQNSIVAGNDADGYPDCSGANFISKGYNLFDDETSCVSTPAEGDLFVDSLGLLPLGTYGSSIPIHPLLGNSVAIDHGNPETPGTSGTACVSSDQRGVSRPIDGDQNGEARCDIGAIEYTGIGTTPAKILLFDRLQFLEMGVNSQVPINVYIFDEFGSGVPGVSVTFSTPVSGPSASFVTNGNQEFTVTSNNLGVANSGLLAANNFIGAYSMTIENDEGLPLILLPLVNLPTINTYTMNNSSNEANLPGVFSCDLSMPNCTNGVDPHADYAQNYAIQTIKYYSDKYNRNSLDNAGMGVISSVHFDSGYNNAFWNGEQMVYGDGKAYPMADDVVAHEITHGVTEHESNLFYYYQSGAINESFSDLWGEFVDLSTPSDLDDSHLRWLIGEKIGTIRSMRYPTNYSDPDKMTSPYYYREPGDYYYTDNGGVHTNSGVNNKAVYLMTDGDTFNGYTITGIGIDKVAAIYYEVNTNLLTSGADYKDLYYAVQQACKTLTGGAEGITAADCVEVQKALDAVEMSLSPVANFNPDPPACAVGFEPNDIFYDGFETESGKWTFQNIAGIGKTWERITGAAANGNYALYGADYQGTDVGAQGLATWVYTNNIAIPAGTIFLHFEHMFGFEDYINNPLYGWDGGQLQYSVNGGGWQDAKGLFAAGVNYNGTVSANYGSQNPIRNQQAFIKDSHGYVASKYNLSSFSGKNLRFRWLIGTDLGYFDVGWMLDEVRVYKCVEQQYAFFTAPGNTGHILQPRAWLKVAPTANAGQVVSVEFHAKYGGTWHHLHTDTDGSDGWGYQWATWNLPDGLVDLQAKVNNSDGQTYTIQKTGLALTTTQNVGNVGITRGGGEPEELGEPVEVGAVPEAVRPLEDLSFTWWRTELSWLKLMY